MKQQAQVCEQPWTSQGACSALRRTIGLQGTRDTDSGTHPPSPQSAMKSSHRLSLSARCSYVKPSPAWGASAPTPGGTAAVAACTLRIQGRAAAQRQAHAGHLRMCLVVWHRRALQCGSTWAWCMLTAMRNDACLHTGCCEGDLQQQQRQKVGPACIVRMSKRPRNSFTEMSRSKTVLYMSAEVPLYQGTMGRKSGCSSILQQSHPVVLRASSISAEPTWGQGWRKASGACTDRGI